MDRLLRCARCGEEFDELNPDLRPYHMGRAVCFQLVRVKKDELAARVIELEEQLMLPLKVVGAVKGDDEK